MIWSLKKRKMWILQSRVSTTCRDIYKGRTPQKPESSLEDRPLTAQVSPLAEGSGTPSAPVPAGVAETLHLASANSV